jgi:hypothetical protein
MLGIVALEGGCYPVRHSAKERHPILPGKALSTSAKAESVQQPAILDEVPKADALDRVLRNASAVTGATRRADSHGRVKVVRWVAFVTAV